MAVKIRLTRLGAKAQPFYRIVVSDSRTKVSGQYLDLIGTYNPGIGVRGKEVKIDSEKALDWLNKGAQLTDTAKNLFQEEKIMEKFHVMKMERLKNKPKKEKKVAPKKVATKKEETKEKKITTKKTTVKKATTKKATAKKEVSK